MAQYVIQREHPELDGGPIYVGAGWTDTGYEYNMIDYATIVMNNLHRSLREPKSYRIVDRTTGEVVAIVPAPQEPA